MRVGDTKKTCATAGYKRKGHRKRMLLMLSQLNINNKDKVEQKNESNE